MYRKTRRGSAHAEVVGAAFACRGPIAADAGPELPARLVLAVRAEPRAAAKWRLLLLLQRRERVSVCIHAHRTQIAQAQLVI